MRKLEKMQNHPTVSDLHGNTEELKNMIKELQQSNSNLANENASLNKKIAELENEKAENDANDQWFKHMTRKNVVEYIASKQDSAQSDDLMSLVKAILPKTMHEQFDKDVEAMREQFDNDVEAMHEQFDKDVEAMRKKRHRKHEKPTTVIHFHDGSTLQVVGDNGTAIDNIGEYYNN